MAWDLIIADKQMIAEMKAYLHIAHLHILKKMIINFATFTYTNMYKQHIYYCALIFWAELEVTMSGESKYGCLTCDM